MCGSCVTLRGAGQTGSFLGMAPEVTLGKDYDEKADVFSLGCVMVDLLGKQLTSSEVRPMFLSS